MNPDISVIDLRLSFSFLYSAIAGFPIHVATAENTDLSYEPILLCKDMTVTGIELPDMCSLFSCLLQPVNMFFLYQSILQKKVEWYLSLCTRSLVEVA